MASVTSNWNLTYEDICRKLVEKENFSFSRWGDGEWACVMGVQGRNCDGHPYFADMSLSLAAILLQDQVCYMGMQPKAMRDMGGKINAWIDEHDCEIDWCDSDIIHDASIEDRLDELGKALMGRQVILIAPHRLKKMAVKLGAAHIKIPLTNVWKWYRQIYGDLLDQIGKDVVVLYCMSMPTKVMTNQVCREYGDTLTQIDIGSAFDPYCGFETRKYHKEIIGRIEG